MTTAADSDYPKITEVDVRCTCGAWIGSHHCYQWAPTPEPEPTYTRGDVERALRVALGGSVPAWLWDAVRADLERTQR